jgi:hypothetical protein
VCAQGKHAFYVTHQPFCARALFQVTGNFQGLHTAASEGQFTTNSETARGSLIDFHNVFEMLLE